ncbi:hypothetical protein ABDI30_23545 [Paenibacillus cisolokensis]|uniref:hypothetical protein n=1 Tax=Paenibacillus cisolokensis TaxID=1658519 RepID=UPI003D291289
MKMSINSKRFIAFLVAIFVAFSAVSPFAHASSVTEPSSIQENSVSTVDSEASSEIVEPQAVGKIVGWLAKQALEILREGIKLSFGKEYNKFYGGLDPGTKTYINSYDGRQRLLRGVDKTLDLIEDTTEYAQEILRSRAYEGMRSVGVPPSYADDIAENIAGTIAWIVFP